jgi:hypothetical protein
MLDTLKKLRAFLRRLADLIADEAERNPDFAAQLQEVVAPAVKVRDGQPRKSQAQLPAEHPFEVYRARGEEGLKSWLESLDITALKAVVRQHRLDPSRLSDKWKTKERFVTLILERVPARLKQGDVFRHYADREDATDKGGPTS